MLGAKIFCAHCADNRHTIETEKTTSETTKAASEILANVGPNKP